MYNIKYIKLYIIFVCFFSLYHSLMNKVAHKMVQVTKFLRYFY